jgi:hypothetical protein
MRKGGAKLAFQHFGNCVSDLCPLGHSVHGDFHNSLLYHAFFLVKVIIPMGSALCHGRNNQYNNAPAFNLLGKKGTAKYKIR